MGGGETGAPAGCNFSASSGFIPGSRFSARLAVCSWFVARGSVRLAVDGQGLGVCEGLKQWASHPSFLDNAIPQFRVPGLRDGG